MPDNVQTLETKVGTLDFNRLRPGSLTAFNSHGSKGYYPLAGYDVKAFDEAGGKAAFVALTDRGKTYTFIPEEYLNKGYTENGRQWLPTELFKDDNLQSFLNQSAYVDLSNFGGKDRWDQNEFLGSSLAPWLENRGMGAKGFLLPADAKTSSGEDFYFTIRPEVSYNPGTHGNVTGLTKRGDQYVYATDKPNGYIDPVTGGSSWYQPPKKNNLASIAGIGLAIFAPGIGSALGAALGLGSGVAAAVVGNAIVQGTMAELSGGEFKDGALRGAIGAGVAPVVANTVGSAVANAMGDSAFNKVVTNAVTSASTAAVSAGLTGNGDIGEAALNAAVASIGGTYGKELGGDTGAKIGTALGKIATGADAEQVLTSTIMDTLKSTVKDALKDSPVKDGAVKVAEAEADVTVPGADDLQKILDGSAGTQLASTDNDAAMQAIDALQKPALLGLTPTAGEDRGAVKSVSVGDDDALLGLSSAEVGQGEIDAITGADTGTAPDDALLGLTPTEVGDRGAIESVNVGDDTLDTLLGLTPTEVGNRSAIESVSVGDDTLEGGVSTDTSEMTGTGENDFLNGLLSDNGVTNEDDLLGGVGDDTIDGGVSTDTTGADSVAGGTETSTVTTGPMGPKTEDQTRREKDEFGKYLDYIRDGEPDAPTYGVQDLGVTDENFKSFDENLKKMLDDGNLPTQWKPGADGTFTLTSDDGSTLTIDADGEIIGSTDAPKGNLLSDTLTTTPPVTTAPVTTAPVTTAPVTTTPPAVKAADDSSGFDLLSLLALMGGEQKPVPQKPEVNDDPFVAFDFNRPFQVNPFAQNPPTPRMAEGGSIDELLELLQYRGQT
jgi:hypothetical protein